ncbi:MAG TPA: transposase [Gaiellaceae bacterium]
MSNSCRIEEIGAFYHVNANALNDMPLFRDDVDRMRFLGLLEDEVEESDWTLLEYTLMTTHYHLLLRLNKCTLSSGFRRLQSRYARTYNRRHNRRGPLWLRRFDDVMPVSERHLFEVIRYIALNAPRAGMVKKADDWPWCSYGAAIGVHPPDPLVDEEALLGLFSPRPAVARRQLRQFVEEVNPRERWRQTQLRRGSEPAQARL